ncbi:hypothetical protein BJX66DRAFT_315304 [Aspergillus keveii]|uniref:NYN domain-containing protein n=1 Tax=Aspergillus keveii TaxID=714993 RepID=A0ABR4FPK5_9EURO
MTQKFTSTSNWDFTAVINLLRSPTSRSGDQSTSASSSTSPDSPVPPLLSHKLVKHAVEKPVTAEQPLGDTILNSRKLGDFDTIWEVLNNPCSSVPTEVAAEVPRQSHQSKNVLRTTKPVVILRRPIPDSSVEITPPTHGTPSKPIPVANPHRTNNFEAGPVVRSKHSARLQRHTYQNDTNNESASLDSNALGESDSPSIFDLPHSKPHDIAPMIPPQLGVSPAKAARFETPPSSFDESDGFLSDTVKHLSNTTRLQPLAYKTAADQKVGLLTKLLGNFPEYAELLVRSGRVQKSKKADISSRPIHVFIDMSNIMVGLHDTMKISRNIPVNTRIRRIPLAFQNFSLILERGRPTAKRVLVGSDRYAAINESEKIGYEANILDRVHKVKTLTPRQLKFRKNPRAALHNGGQSSETNDVPEQRWVEQAVDEILHLKILESLVDVDEPATIVLATGDAAEAEFSGGFLKMVERALQRGWKVELVSFSQVTSYSYRRKEFRSRWGDHFRIIALDDYIEELLDM